MTIADLAEMIREIVEFRERIVWDRTKPDGVPRKLLDITQLTALRWRAMIDLCTGMTGTYHWFGSVGSNIAAKCNYEGNNDE